MRGQIQRGPNGTETSLRHALVLLRMKLERIVTGGERDFMPAKSQAARAIYVASFTTRIIQRQVPTVTSSLIKSWTALTTKRVASFAGT